MRVWSSNVGQDGRNARDVSIGNHGTEVFSDLAGTSGAQRLLSVYDDTTPTPIWQSTPTYHSMGNKVASAEMTGTHVALSYKQASNGGARFPVVAKYLCASSVPQWTYTFPSAITLPANPAGGVGISRDGQTTVAWVFKGGPSETLLAVFNGSSGTPSYVTSLPTNFEPKFGRLSADGSTFMLLTGDRTWIYDVRARSVILFDVNWYGVGAGHAISGDGMTFAKSLSDKKIEVYRRQGSTYALSSTVEVDANWQCAQAALSDTGSILACAWGNMFNLTDVRVQAYEVSGGAQPPVFDQTFVGSGWWANIATDMAISADGTKFAIGLSGDLNGAVDELQAFGRNSQTGTWSNVLSFPLPGTVWDVDLSADGRMLAAASSANHLSQGGTGGEISLFDLGERDLVLEGVPHAGSTVALHQFMSPGQSGRLYVAPRLGVRPTVLAGLGTLFLQRSSTTFTPIGVAGSDGVLTTQIPLSALSSAIGTTRYYQGLSLNPPRLTETLIPMTILP